MNEWYENREDKLKCKTHERGQVTEDFFEGRPRSLKQHIYKANSPGVETDRTMHFYDVARYSIFFVAVAGGFTLYFLLLIFAVVAYFSRKLNQEKIDIMVVRIVRFAWGRVCTH